MAELAKTSPADERHPELSRSNISLTALRLQRSTRAGHAARTEADAVAEGVARLGAIVSSPRQGPPSGPVVPDCLRLQQQGRSVPTDGQRPVREVPGGEWSAPGVIRTQMSTPCVILSASSRRRIPMTDRQPGAIPIRC